MGYSDDAPLSGVQKSDDDAQASGALRLADDDVVAVLGAAHGCPLSQVFSPKVDSQLAPQILLKKSGVGSRWKA